ncbi:MAG TPA: ribosomal L7Ae/L30e/S12e/Gadd45 family protein [Gemmatimonadales bacterium]|nr:ribosomal L7Ae/L30e/S12e/Gadd45 family protein [Gemmatimonadales bacterium]
MNEDARLRLLGLGARARRVVIGVTGVRAKLQEGVGSGLACVVLAADASLRTQEKVGRLAAARGVPVLRGPSAERMGAGLGRPSVQAVGVSDPALARGLVRLSEE